MKLQNDTCNSDVTVNFYRHLTCCVSQCDVAARPCYISELKWIQRLGTWTISMTWKINLRSHPRLSCHVSAAMFLKNKLYLFWQVHYKKKRWDNGSNIFYQSAHMVLSIFTRSKKFYMLSRRLVTLFLFAGIDHVTGSFYCSCTRFFFTFLVARWDYLTEKNGIFACE